MMILTNVRTTDSTQGVNASDIQCKESEYRKLEDPDYDENEPRSTETAICFQSQYSGYLQDLSVW